MYVRHRSKLIEVQTPAKVNLFLEVLARRDDGFHEIETLMVPISLFDTLWFAAHGAAGIDVSCRWATGIEAQRTSRSNAGRNQFSVAPSPFGRGQGSSVPSPFGRGQGSSVPSPFGRGQGEGRVWETLPTSAENLATRALELLRQRAGVEAGGAVRLVKRIPAAAGLGGASSDAAAALVAANIGWGLGWSRDRLAAVAAEIGSDVPFFLQVAPCVCRGRGERIEPIADVGKLHLVLVRPPVGLSTPDVYRHGRPAERPRTVDAIVAAARRGDPAAVGRLLFNRLQEDAERLSTWIGRLRDAFDRLDCLGHQMSGSGSSYFGVCRHARHARRVAGVLRAAGVGAVFPATTALSHRPPGEGYGLTP